MFNEQKAAQIAAWFIDQEGGSMPHLKLIKLMYLAEREAINRYGFPLTGDRLVAMPHGPVLSITLDHINDEVDSAADGGWDEWVSDRAGHTVALNRDVHREALDELSEADLKVLGETWKRFGWMSKYQLRNYTHNPTNCPEWEHPQDSSRTISYETLFEALGHSPEQARVMADEIRAHARIEASLTR